MAKNDLGSMFARMPSEDLKRLINIAQSELDNRGPRDVAGMSDSEFRKYVDQQFRNADRAAREADLRDQLHGKPETKKDSKNERE